MAFIGMAELPFGYYTFLRWVLSIAAILLAIFAIRFGQLPWLMLAIPIFALWFPPFGVGMTKNAWVLLDLLAGLGLLLAGVLLVRPADRDVEEEHPK